ncbi:MAG: hypothetical protein HN563_06330, partial [Flavobacteriales bacterium]|nr:hypothetical protein [Flavobacteriales bacterium]
MLNFLKNKCRSLFLFITIFNILVQINAQECTEFEVCDSLEINIEIIGDDPCNLLISAATSEFSYLTGEYNSEIQYLWSVDGDSLANGIETEIPNLIALSGDSLTLMFEITLTSLDSLGIEYNTTCFCSEDFSMQNLVESYDSWSCDCNPSGPPVASFYIENENACGNQGIIFINTVTGGEGPTFDWSFGDNYEYGESFEASPTVDILIDGGGISTIPVTLTVVDNNGCTDSITQDVEILDTPNPGNDFSIGNACTGNPDSTQVDIVLQPEPYGQGGIELITIDWGTVINTYTPSPFPINTIESPIYSDFGYYPIIIELLAYNGCITEIVDSLFIGNNPQIGTANPGNTDGLCAPYELTFPISNTETNDPSTIYEVDFGDGSTPLILSHPPPLEVTHTYTSSSCGFTSPLGSQNSYMFKITAENECGQSSNTVEPVRIHSAPDPVISGEPYVCAGVEYQWISPETGTWVDANSTDCIINAGNWQVVDPETGFPAFLPDVNPVFTASTTNFETTFFTAGIYNIQVTEDHPVCNSDSDTFEVCVYPDEFEPEALSFPENGCAPLTVNLNDITPPLSCGNVDINWSVEGGPFQWADGSGPGSLDPVVVLLEEGDYEITLTHVPDFAYVDSTLYIVDVAQIAGCYNYDSNLPGDTTAVEATCPVGEVTIEIEVYDEPYMQIISDEYFCEGDIINVSTIEFNDGNIDDYEFLWYVDNEIFSTTIDPITLEFQQQGTHTIEAVATNMCGSHASEIFVSVNENPTITVTSPIGDCIGNTITAIASGANEYSWTNNNPVSSQFGNPVDYTIFSTTTETVTGILNHPFISCTSTETFQITAYPLPQIEILGDVSICEQEELVLNTEISNGTPDYTVTWSLPNSSDTDTEFIIEATTNLTITVNVVDVNECESSDEVAVTVFELPFIEAGNDIEFCDQSILTSFTENNPPNGTWQGVGITNSWTGEIDPSLIGVGQSTITYLFTDDYGCTNSDSLLVNVVEPVFANAGPDMTVCDIDTTIILGGFTPSDGQWADPAIDSNYNLNVSDLTPGVYPYTFQYGEETCFTEDFMLLEIYERPNIYWDAPNALCLYETGAFNLTIDGGTGPYFIEWITEMNNVSSDGYTASNSWNSTGPQEIEIFVTDFNGCQNYLSFDVFIYDLPIVSAGPDTTFCNLNNSIGQLEGFSPTLNQDGSGYFYGIDDAFDAVSIDGEFNPSISGAGVFDVVYSYTNAQTLCTNTDTVQVIVSELIVANAGLDTIVCHNAPLLQLEGFYPDIGVLWSGLNATAENSIINSQTGLINPQLLP